MRRRHFGEAPGGACELSAPRYLAGFLVEETTDVDIDIGVEDIDIVIDIHMGIGIDLATVVGIDTGIIRYVV